MFCNKCGAKLKDQAKFCNVCGEKTKYGKSLSNEQTSPLPQIQPSVNVQKPQIQQPIQAPPPTPPVNVTQPKIQIKNYI